MTKSVLADRPYRTTFPAGAAIAVIELDIGADTVTERFISRAYAFAVVANLVA